MEPQSLVLAVVLAAVAVVAAFVAGLALAGHDTPDRYGPAMMVGRAYDGSDGWGRGPMTDKCPGWSGLGRHHGMMRFDPDR